MLTRNNCVATTKCVSNKGYCQPTSKRMAKGHLTEEETKDLKTYSSVFPNYYGLVKVHNESYPLRPIISCVKINVSHALASFDVISLLTNIPLHLIIDILAQNYNFISQHTSIPQHKHLSLLFYLFLV